ncbi:ATP-binding protein [Methylogaea oryzae]|uniref:ATPase n=2 Tax=Methylogaea oryzae TaxID=1295382 RepID=A0A8D4VUD3_9GAMM|nr:ATP-binding protein [Methylogaea oryzae]BBL72822.1 ATPase [Methylogaea oryzae]
MSAATWQENNNRYLAASLHWLRLKLQQPGAEAKPAEQSAAGLFGLGKSASAGKTKGAPTAQQLKQAAEERDKAAAVDPKPALLFLAQQFRLSAFERDTLLLCAAMELDPALADLCAKAQGGAGRNYPTFGLALSAFDDPAWDALSAERPLRYARLLEINQPGATPLIASPLRADERIVNFIKGLNVLDDRLGILLSPADAAAALADSQQALVDAVLQRLRQSAAESVLPVVQLVGSDGDSKLAVAGRIATALGRRLYRAAAAELPAAMADNETLTRLWQRESLLLPVALYIDADNLDAGPGEGAAVQRFLARESGVVLLGVRDAPLRISSASFAVNVDKPTAAEQRDAWFALLQPAVPAAQADEAAHRLAGQFDLSLHDIQTAAAAAKAEQGNRAPADDLWSRCRELTRPRLDALAQPLVPKAIWDDLVLPEESAKLLRQIAGQVRGRHKVYEDWGFSSRMNRGFGISALFSGESGTGKTMAAEVIANDLRLNLYRIDLSAVVSKYIGETEKNLRKLFDAAEQGGAILFFDEADALFGKRSEVKDSHDRYANIEINYLLQRMEAFRGLAILATNMKSALDTAFMRRLRFVVNFQFPGVQERKLIWQKALPPQTPQESLDFDRLARLNLTGGNIHSVALNAAFQAAAAGLPVSMGLMLDAARSEMRKLDKPVNEAEFRLLDAVKGRP